MQSIVIEGGKRLNGEVKISGAKNSALPILCATLLAPGEHVISNVPVLRDVTTMGKLLENLGAKVEHVDGVFHMNTRDLTNDEAPYDLVKTMRASVLVLGPLVARQGKAKVSLPGGCAIGARPINLHLAGLRAMGAEVEIEHGYVVARAKRLKGARIYLDTPTVTGTENLMMAATLADGKTVLENAACEPEITDLAACLTSMGAKIRGAGTDRIEIEGVEGLSPAKYSVMPDRIETGTYLAAGAITGGEVKLTGCAPAHSAALLTKLRECGLEIESGDDWIRLRNIRQAARRGHKDPAVPGFSDGHAGAVHGAHVRGGRAFRDNGDGVREPVHAHRGDPEDGRGHKGAGERGSGAGGEAPVRGAGDGDGPAGQRVADGRGACGERQLGNLARVSPGPRVREHGAEAPGHRGPHQEGGVKPLPFLKKGSPKNF